MQPQEIFDTVATHLFTQGVQAKKYNMDDVLAVCQYRGPNHTKCAVGCLLPDEFYFPDMEGETISGLFSENKWVLPDFFKPNLDLLRDLQEVHDADRNWETTERMKDKLNLVSDVYGISPVILQKLKFTNR